MTDPDEGCEELLLSDTISGGRIGTCVKDGDEMYILDLTYA